MYFRYIKVGYALHGHVILMHSPITTHVGAEPFQFPSSLQVRVTSPVRLNPVIHVYSAVEPSVVVGAETVPLAGAAGVPQSEMRLVVRKPVFRVSTKSDTIRPVHHQMVDACIARYHCTVSL